MCQMTHAIYKGFLRQVYEYFPFCEIEFPKWNVAFTMHFDGCQLRISGNGQKVLQISVLCICMINLSVMIHSSWRAISYASADLFSIFH